MNLSLFPFPSWTLVLVLLLPEGSTAGRVGVRILRQCQGFRGLPDRRRGRHGFVLPVLPGWHRFTAFGGTHR